MKKPDHIILEEVHSHHDQRVGWKILRIILPIISTIFLITAIILHIYFVQQENKLKETTGVIVDIKSYVSVGSMNGEEIRDEYYMAYVDYTVNGVEYKNIQLNYYTSSMKIGDDVIIRYDPQKPEKPASISLHNETLYITFYTLGILTFLVAIFYNQRVHKRIHSEETNKQELLTHGIIERVTITHIHPVKNGGQYFDCYIRGHIYSSIEFLENKNINIGDTVNIYFDKHQYNHNIEIDKMISKYYIDITSVEHNNKKVWSKSLTLFYIIFSSEMFALGNASLKDFFTYESKSIFKFKLDSFLYNDFSLCIWYA